MINGSPFRVTLVFRGERGYRPALPLHIVTGARRHPSVIPTIINDEDFAIRNAMEAWSNFINSHDSNSRGLPQQYKSTASVTQYSKDGSPLRTYIFEGLFPTTIDGIALDWSQQDTIEEFGVTFQYDLWRVEGITGVPTT